MEYENGFNISSFKKFDPLEFKKLDEFTNIPDNLNRLMHRPEGNKSDDLSYVDLKLNRKPDITVYRNNRVKL